MGPPINNVTRGPPTYAHPSGCEVFTKDFVVAGTCSENLYGMCESLYRPDLGPEELFEVRQRGSRWLVVLNAGDDPSVHRCVV